MNQRRIVARSSSEFDPDFGRYATVIANLLRHGECPRGEGSSPVSLPPPFFFPTIENRSRLFRRYAETGFEGLRHSLDERDIEVRTIGDIAAEGVEKADAGARAVSRHGQQFPAELRLGEDTDGT